MNPTFDPVNIGSFYPLLDKGTVDAAAVFTTDPQLRTRQVRRAEGHEVHLRLPERRTWSSSKSAVQAEGPAFLKTINKVSALLTQKAIITLNAAVELDQQSPASVAKAFLKANHLL